MMTVLTVWRDLFLEERELQGLGQRKLAQPYRRDPCPACLARLHVLVHTQSTYSHYFFCRNHFGVGGERYRMFAATVWMSPPLRSNRA